MEEQLKEFELNLSGVMLFLISNASKTNCIDALIPQLFLARMPDKRKLNFHQKKQTCEKKWIKFGKNWQPT